MQKLGADMNDMNVKSESYILYMYYVFNEITQCFKLQQPFLK